MYAVMVSQEMSWWTAAALTQWGREVSRARSLEKRRKKLEISEISRQQKVGVELLELPVYDFKTGAMGVCRLREHTQELSGAFPLANLGWVEQLVVQVSSVKAVIAAFALGLRLGKLKRAVLQLVFNWIEGTLVQGGQEQGQLEIESELGEEEKHKKKKTRVPVMSTSCAVTGEMKWRRRRPRALLQEWETRKKDEIGAAVQAACSGLFIAKQEPARVK